MNKELVEYIHGLPIPPVLDVRGEWVHCNNLRVASTSINIGVLRQRIIIHNRGHRNWDRVWQEIIVPHWDRLVLFSFVRNPWDKVCSAFHHCRDRARNRENKIDKKWTFNDWVQKVLAVKGTSVNRHFYPQYDNVCFRGGFIPGMFVGRFERIDRDWNTIATKLGIKTRLPKTNKGDQGSYVKKYDSRSRQIVSELYAPEIELLGYRFGK